MYPPDMGIDMEFNVISEQDIMEGQATDAYFMRTEEALKESDTDPVVTAEVTADQFSDGGFEVFAGLRDATKLLEGLPVVDVDSLPEGQLFDGGPVMRITGNYAYFARFETSLLGFLSHASGIATAAREVVTAANGEADVISFGARHVNPFIGGVVERNALLGGMDGYSLVAAEKDLPGEASGTMPHALMLAHGRGNQEEAWRAFNDGVPEGVPRIILADTFTDETDEVRRAVAELGDDLSGVRLDTTGSRRGSFEHIIKEVAATLAGLDRDDVDIFVSGGIDPDDIRELRRLVDGFGVGGYVSNADPVDFSLDIVEIDGQPISKRGKLAGVKNVYRMPSNGDDHDEHIATTTELLNLNELMEPLIREGEVVRDFDFETAIQRCEADAEGVGFRVNTDEARTEAMR